MADENRIRIMLKFFLLYTGKDENFFVRTA